MTFDNQAVEIPQTLPMLPVRDIVVFPYMIIPLFVAIFTLMSQKCLNCNTSFQDNRINRAMKMWPLFDTKILDECPVCHHEMFLDQVK